MGPGSETVGHSLDSAADGSGSAAQGLRPCRQHRAKHGGPDRETGTQASGPPSMPRNLPLCTDGMEMVLSARLSQMYPVANPRTRNHPPPSCPPWVSPWVRKTADRAPESCPYSNSTTHPHRNFLFNNIQSRLCGYLKPLRPRSATAPRPSWTPSYRRWNQCVKCLLAPAQEWRRSPVHSTGSRVWLRVCAPHLHTRPKPGVEAGAPHPGHLSTTRPEGRRIPLLVTRTVAHTRSIDRQSITIVKINPMCCFPKSMEAGEGLCMRGDHLCGHGCAHPLGSVYI